MKRDLQSVVVYVGNRLTRHGFNPTTIDTLSEKLGGICRIISVSDKRSLILRMLDMVHTIWRYRRRTRIVLIDTYSTLAFYYALVVALECIFFGNKYVPILHGGDLPKRLRQSKKLCDVLFGRSWINVSPSLYLKQEFDKAGYRVQHIPNFISISQYPHSVRERVRPRLLFVRSFHAMYNPMLAVHVLEEIASEFSDAYLCMIGPDKDGSLEGVRKLADDLGLSGRIELPGRLEKKDWVGRAASFDFFINTTNVDNMPVSIIEAMALGLVVITTNLGEIPTVIKHGVNGILVSPGNKAEFVHWIRHLIANPDDAQRISCNARRRAESFDWSAVERQWRSVVDADREL